MEDRLLLWVVQGQNALAARRMAGQQGQGLSEYAILLAVVAAAAIVGATVLSGQLQTLFTRVANQLAKL